MPPETIRSRLKLGRLHLLWPGVYAVGRRELDADGRFMAATLACGNDARLAGRSAADLWGIRAQRDGLIEVAVPKGSCPRRRGIRLRRRLNLPAPRHVRFIPVADPVSVLIELAAELSVEEVEDAVNAADRLGLVRTHRLRAILDACPSRPGVGSLKRILDAQTFSRSQTILERRFLSLVRDAGLPLPTSQKRIGKYRVDFIYLDHRLVVEADSLRYHRTPASQTKDLERDQAHTRAGLRTLRFTHFQVFKRHEYVSAVLAETLSRSTRRAR
jgi:very-short-patch-repair endonuclease